MKPTLIALVVLAVVAVLAILAMRSRRHVVRDLRPLTMHVFKDAISVVKSGSRANSYFGGAPPQSTHYSWPARNGRPLSFLACIDCSELPRSAELDWRQGWRKCLLRSEYD